MGEKNNKRVQYRAKGIIGKGNYHTRARDDDIFPF